MSLIIIIIIIIIIKNIYKAPKSTKMRCSGTQEGEPHTARKTGKAIHKRTTEFGNKISKSLNSLYKVYALTLKYKHKG